MSSTTGRSGVGSVNIYGGVSACGVTTHSGALLGKGVGWIIGTVVGAAVGKAYAQWLREHPEAALYNHTEDAINDIFGRPRGTPLESAKKLDKNSGRGG